jgi:hypothetical protein
MQPIPTRWPQGCACTPCSTQCVNDPAVAHTYGRARPHLSSFGSCLREHLFDTTHPPNLFFLHIVAAARRVRPWRSRPQRARSQLVRCSSAPLTYGVRARSKSAQGRCSLLHARCAATLFAAQAPRSPMVTRSLPERTNQGWRALTQGCCTAPQMLAAPRATRCTSVRCSGALLTYGDQVRCQSAQIKDGAPLQG